MKLKLWLCSANCTDYEPCELHVAETEEEAKEKMANSLSEDGIWYASVYADEVVEVDGYGIDLCYEKKKME